MIEDLTATNVQGDEVDVTVETGEGYVHIEIDDENGQDGFVTTSIKFDANALSDLIAALTYAQTQAFK